MAPIDVLNQISDVIWEIPVSFKDGMRVPAMWHQYVLWQSAGDFAPDLGSLVAGIRAIARRPGYAHGL